MSNRNSVASGSLFTEEHRDRLQLRARVGRPLTVVDVSDVMSRVEVTDEILIEVRAFLTENEILFDDSADAVSRGGDDYAAQEFSDDGADSNHDSSNETAEGGSENDKSAGSGGFRRHRTFDATRVAAAAMAQASTSADPVRMYLKEIGKVPLLAAEEEVWLAKRIESGAAATSVVAEHLSDGTWGKLDRTEQRQLRRTISEGDRARSDLTSANLRLVVSIAKRYVGRSVPMLDLIQEGNLGLMRAVEKFDHSKGFKFSTYATWWIRQAITRAIADQSRTIRVPVHMVEAINKVVRTQRSMLQKLEREPTMAEIAEEVDLTEERVTEILRIAQQDPLSLDTPIGDEDDTSMADFIPDKGAAPLDLAARKLLAQTVQDVLGELSDREAEVVRLRFGLDDGRPRTLEEVGRAFGVTRERIRQIESKTLAKLRHPLRSDRLRDYLD